MKFIQFFIVLFLLITSISNSEPSETNKSVILNEAKNLLKETAKQYKNTLIQGLQHNNLIKALKYCNKEVEKLVSKDNEKGFAIKRVSLRPRNKNNYPNLYEKEILEKFNKLSLIDNKDLALEHSDIIKDENNNKFVYIKAIRIKEVCLNCHGSNINDDLKKEIQKLYPDDKAINYKLNDIRGAFVMYRNIKD
tara:strand:+ start:348 stop:926 length:579 start_codon:yes stop_codon:yes gene_type:complete